MQILEGHQKAGYLTNDGWEQMADLCWMNTSEEEEAVDARLFQVWLGAMQAQRTKRGVRKRRRLSAGNEYRGAQARHHNTDNGWEPERVEPRIVHSARNAVNTWIQWADLRGWDKSFGAEVIQKYVRTTSVVSGNLGGLCVRCGTVVKGRVALFYHNYHVYTFCCDPKHGCYDALLRDVAELPCTLECTWVDLK